MVSHSGMSQDGRSSPTPKDLCRTSPRIQQLHAPRSSLRLALGRGTSLEAESANGIDTTLRDKTRPGRPAVERPNSLLAVTTPEVLAILAEKAGTPGLKLKLELGIHLEGCFLITIGSNYSFLKDRKFITQGRIDALDKYLKEHGIVENSPAWHLDYDHYKWRRICCISRKSSSPPSRP